MIFNKYIIESKKSGDTHANEMLIQIVNENSKVLIDRGSNRSSSHPAFVFETKSPNFFKNKCFVINKNVIDDAIQMPIFP